MNVLFDIGGTRTRIAMASNNQSFEQPVVVDTPADFEMAIELIVRTVRDLLGNQNIDKICGGLAGQTDVGGKVVFAPNLPKWIGKNIVEAIAQELNAPVTVYNDTQLAGLGEVYFGAGNRDEITTYITISTGVGGARIVNGKLDKTASGTEPGWQYIFGQGQKSSRGTEFDALELFVSGTAMAKRYRVARAVDITDVKIWNEAAKLIAYGLYNAATFWSPHSILLGGSVMQSISIKQIVEHYSSITPPLPHTPSFHKAKLGDESGLYGALICLTTGT